LFPLEPPTGDDRFLWDTQFAHLQIHTITLAEELGLFSLLAGEPLAREEIGRRLGLHPRACEVLLAVLMGLGLLAQHDGRIALTPSARNFLLPESPYDRGALIRRGRGAKHYETVREAILRDRERRTDLPETGDPSLEDARWVTEGMHLQSLPAAVALARLGDFTGVEHLLDVGGGSGCFSIALAARNPQMRFTILELPPVCSVAREYVAEAGMQERVRMHAADMFRDPWPAGPDVHFFSNIFHGWDRDLCLELARRSFESLPPGGRIDLHEALLNDARDGPLTVALFSLAMMLNGEGKQYTAGELREMLEECGFRGVRVTPTYGYYSLVTGHKPEQ
jgi:acetylserotonin N-methyltransferase